MAGSDFVAHYFQFLHLGSPASACQMFEFYPLLLADDLDDGQFEVMLVRDPGSGNVIELNKITTAILQGTFASPYIRLLHSSRAKFTFGEPVKWTRDGEAGGAHRTVTLENQHSAYSILL